MDAGDRVFLVWLRICAETVQQLYQREGLAVVSKRRVSDVEGRVMWKKEIDE
jgi:hypothetical protein